MGAARIARELSQPRRGLRREAAAIYVGISPTKFDQLVRDGRLPKPKRIDGIVIWDRFRLDEIFDDLPSDTDTTNPWD